MELRKTFTDIEAGQHHKLTFKAKDGNGTIPDELGFIEILEGLYLDASIISEDITADIPMEEDIIEGETRPGTEDGGEEPDPGPDPGEDGMRGEYPGKSRCRTSGGEDRNRQC